MEDQRRGGDIRTWSRPSALRGTGWGTWIRTKTNRVRVCCATVTPFPTGFPNNFNSLERCSEAGRKLKRKSAFLASGPSTRSLPDLASAVICGCVTGLFGTGRRAWSLRWQPCPYRAHRASRHSNVSFELPISTQGQLFFDKLPSVVWRCRRLPALGRHAMLVHRNKGQGSGRTLARVFPQRLGPKNSHKTCSERRSSWE